VTIPDVSGLPTDIDATFDDIGSPGRKAHQQHHDKAHEAVKALVSEAAGRMVFRPARFGGVQQAVSAAQAAGGGDVELPTGTTVLTAPVSITGSGVRIVGKPGARVDGSAIANDGSAFLFDGVLGAGVTPTAVTQNATTVTVPDGSVFTAGDAVLFRSMQPFDLTRGPTTYNLSEWNRVKSVSGNTLTLEQRIQYPWNHASFPVTLFKPATLRDVGLSDVEIVMGGAGKNQHGAYFSWCENLSVRDIKIRDAEQGGVRVSRSFGGTVSGSHVRRSNSASLGYGFYVDAAEDITISGCTGQYNRRSFEVNGGSGNNTGGLARNIVIDGNVARGDLTSGIGTHAGSDVVSITDNIVEECGGGIIIRGGRHRVADNIIRRCTTGGLSYSDGIRIGGWLSGTTGAANTQVGIGGVVAGWRAEIVDNHIEGCRYGIRTDDIDVADLLIAGNTIIDNTDRPIAIIGGTRGDRVRIVDNTMTGGASGNYGVFVGVRCHQLEIARNNIRATVTAGIRVEGGTAGDPHTDLTIADNIVRSGGSYGVDTGVGSFTRLVITDNVTFGCSVAGVRAVAGGNIVGIRPVIVNNRDDTHPPQGAVFAAAARPTVFTWRQGDFVWNTAPTVTGSRVVLGWLRLTNGSGSVLNTDWVEVGGSTS
jgi:hypothetical protein